MTIHQPCHEWERHLAMLHPDNLSPAEDQALHAHLAVCPICAQVAHENEQVDQLVLRALTPDRPMHQWENFLARGPNTEPLSSVWVVPPKQKGLFRAPIFPRTKAARKGVAAALTTLGLVILNMIIFFREHILTLQQLVYVELGVVLVGISIITLVGHMGFFKQTAVNDRSRSTRGPVSICVQILTVVLCFIIICTLFISLVQIRSASVNTPALSFTPSSSPFKKATVVPTSPVDKTKPVDTKPVDKTRDVTPTPTVESDQQVVVNFTEHYADLVFSQLFRRAYAKLSASLRNSEPYADFVQNANYTLAKGCWKEGQNYISQLDDHTWVVGLEMMQVSCVDGNVTLNYSWVFHVSLANGPPEIIAIGLYPIGAGK